MEHILVRVIRTVPQSPFQLQMELYSYSDLPSALAGMAVVSQENLRSIEFDFCAHPSDLWFVTNHKCNDDCMCFALGCECEHCAAINRRLDPNITDERKPK